MVKYRGAEWIGLKGVLITSGVWELENGKINAIIRWRPFGMEVVCVSEGKREITWTLNEGSNW